jgi:phosphoribosylamine--glycine ligase
MKILVIGSGGREHAIVWKLRQSASVEKVWCAPGNGGIAQHAECAPLDLKDVNAAAGLAESLGADLTIVGPELPLVLGIVNEFSRRGLTILGPTRDAAQLEGSKIFAKQFMERHRIPTASIYGICDSAVDARKALEQANWPVVIKADGLCAGKGVLVTSSPDEAAEFISRVMDKHEFGDAGERVLLEEGLRGQELSYIILTDGDHFIPMAPTRDHKRAFDNDQGPNTGGMGAYSTGDILSPDLERIIVDTIVQPTLQGLRKDGLPYRGFLYFGLMLTAEGPKILEYNCRLGDPETEVILLRADFDLAQACAQAIRGNLAAFQAKWTSGASACVVIASEGYPSNPITGRQIFGLDAGPDSRTSVVFHAGTRMESGRYYTNGGRVLVVAANGADLAQACANAYQAVRSIKCGGAFYRTDIGASEQEKALHGQAAKSIR